MDASERNLLLLKVVIGSAWVDGQLEPEELDYLKQILERHHLADNYELQAMLKQPIPLDATENWIINYLARATEQQRDQMLMMVIGVITADGVIDSSEHSFLLEYQGLMSRIPARPDTAPDLAKALRQMVQQAAKLVQTKVL